MGIAIKDERDMSRGSKRKAPNECVNDNKTRIADKKIANSLLHYRANICRLQPVDNQWEGDVVRSAAARDVSVKE